MCCAVPLLARAVGVSSVLHNRTLFVVVVIQAMSSGEEPPLLPTPSTFSDGLAPTRIVVACTFDPLGLQGPLHVWLHSLTGLRCEISWVGYGMVLDAVADASSAWGSNDGGLNVLLLRWCDMRRANYSALEDAAALLLEALRASIARRGAPTLVLLPPPAADGDGGEAATALTAELRAIGGACVVVDSGELRGALGSLRRFHSPFLDQVARTHNTRTHRSPSRTHRSPTRTGPRTVAAAGSYRLRGRDFPSLHAGKASACVEKLA